jgi:hypothetical protein
MQNSELFRRGIILPLDDRAEQSLRLNAVDATTHVQKLRIKSDTLFDSLWNIGLFHDINQRCGTLIDDYEEEFVEASDVQNLMAAIEVAVSKGDKLDSNARSFIADFQSLTIKALELNRPVVFIL